MLSPLVRHLVTDMVTMRARLHQLRAAREAEMTGEVEADEVEEVGEDGEPGPREITRHKQENPKVVVNVGGSRHEVTWAVLERRPLTRLGQLAKARTHQAILRLVDAYSLPDNEAGPIPSHPSNFL